MDHLIIEEANSLKNILKQVDLVAPTNYSVIIYGENGSGKETIARELHRRSRRYNKPFVAIDCAALSGEPPGSALQAFEAAHNGTVFLDGIAHLSHELQLSLLQVIQEREMKAANGREVEPDIRIIVGSNEILWNAVRAGMFREDLYHRLNEFCIDVSSLSQEILRHPYLGTGRAPVPAHPLPGASVKPGYASRENSLKEAGIDAEYEMIVETLKKVNFNKSKAARLLNIDRKTLYNKMSQYRELKNQ